MGKHKEKDKQARRSDSARPWIGGTDLRALAETLPGIVLVADPSGELCHANSLARAMNLTPGGRWLDAVAPEFRHAAEAAWADAVATAEPRETVLALRSEGGDAPRPLLCRMAPVQEQWRVAHWIITFAEPDSQAEEVTMPTAARTDGTAQNLRRAITEALEASADPNRLVLAVTEALGQGLGAAEAVLLPLDGSGPRGWRDGSLPPLEPDTGLWRLGLEPEQFQDGPVGFGPGQPSDAPPWSGLVHGLRRDRRLAGLILIRAHGSRGWTLREATLLESTGERLWSALERAIWAERLREVEAAARREAEAAAAAWRDAEFARGTEALVLAALDAAELGFWNLDIATGAVGRTPRHDRLFGETGHRPDWSWHETESHVLERDRPALREALDHALESGLMAVEVRTADPDGLLRWLALHGRALAGPGSTPARLVGVVADVTDRRSAEERLRHAEAGFRARLDALPQIVWAALPDGWVEYWNSLWFEFSGQHPAAAEGDGWVACVHPDHRAALRERWRHAFATGEPLEVELLLRRRDGSWRWSLMRGRPVRDAKGLPLRWLGTLADIHDLVEARDVLAKVRRGEAGAAHQAAREDSALREEFGRHLGHFADSGGRQAVAVETAPGHQPEAPDRPALDPILAGVGWPGTIVAQDAGQPRGPLPAAATPSAPVVPSAELPSAPEVDSESGQQPTAPGGREAIGAGSTDWESDDDLDGLMGRLRSDLLREHLAAWRAASGLAAAPLWSSFSPGSFAPLIVEQDETGCIRVVDPGAPPDTALARLLTEAADGSPSADWGPWRHCATLGRPMHAFVEVRLGPTRHDRVERLYLPWSSDGRRIDRVTRFLVAEGMSRARAVTP